MSSFFEKIYYCYTRLRERSFRDAFRDFGLIAIGVPTACMLFVFFIAGLFSSHALGFIGAIALIVIIGPICGIYMYWATAIARYSFGTFLLAVLMHLCWYVGWFVFVLNVFTSGDPMRNCKSSSDRLIGRWEKLGGTFKGFAFGDGHYFAPLSPSISFDSNSKFYFDNGRSCDYCLVDLESKNVEAKPKEGNEFLVVVCLNRSNWIDTLLTEDELIFYSTAYGHKIYAKYRKKHN